MAILYDGRPDSGAGIDDCRAVNSVPGYPSSIQIVDSPDGIGRMFRFEHFADYPDLYSDARVNRAMALEPQPDLRPPAERWYALDIYIPTVDDYRGVFPEHIRKVTLCQWHDSGWDDVLGRDVPLSITWLDNGAYLYIRSKSDSTFPPVADPQSWSEQELAKYPAHNLRGRRISLVMHVIWDYGPGGLCELWIDHYPVFSKIGPIGFSGPEGVYFMNGLDHIKRTVNADQVVLYNNGGMIGDETSSYYEMTGRYPHPTVAQRGALV